MTWNGELADLPADYSAIVLDAEGNIVSAQIPKYGEDEYVSRGALIACLLLCIPPARLDALIQEFIPDNKPD